MRWIAVSALLIVFGCLTSGCGQQQAQQRQPGPPQAQGGKQGGVSAQAVPVMVDKVT